MVASPRTTMTYAQYLAAEETSDVKHEYLRGQVWERERCTIDEVLRATAIVSALGSALRNRPCLVLGSLARIRIGEHDRTTYPDACVVCGACETAVDDACAVTNPALLVEVLSEATEAADRGEKFQHYRHIASLRGYLMVSHHAPHLELWTRRRDGWVLTEARAGERMRIHPLEIDVSVDDIYRDPLA